MRRITGVTVLCDESMRGAGADVREGAADGLKIRPTTLFRDGHYAALLARRIGVYAATISVVDCPSGEQGWLRGVWRAFERRWRRAAKHQDAFTRL
jgi:hypothetical protein